MSIVSYAKIANSFSLVVSLALCCACGELTTNSESSLSITNSIPTGNYTSVVKIVRSVDGRTDASCSGTNIGHGLILSAAHCTGLVGGTYIFEVELPDATRVKAQLVATHPLYSENKPSPQPHDLAIFSIHGVCDLPPVELKVEGAVRRGQSVTMVGFGKSEVIPDNPTPFDFDRGVKRVGKSKVFAVLGTGLIAVAGNPSFCAGASENSVTGNGDSGGPLLVDGQLAGVTVGGGLLSQGDSTKCARAVSYFANLQVSENSDFIQKFLRLENNQ